MDKTLHLPKGTIAKPPAQQTELEQLRAMQAQVAAVPPPNSRTAEDAERERKAREKREAK